MANSWPVKMKLQREVFKKEKAWYITFEDGRSEWIPFSCITEYNSGQLTIKIASWILESKQIKFKF